MQLFHDQMIVSRSTCPYVVLESGWVAEDTYTPEKEFHGNVALMFFCGIPPFAIVSS